MIGVHSQRNSVAPSVPSAWIRYLFGGWMLAFKDIHHGLVIPFQKLESAFRTGIVFMGSLVITWFVYVPIHELLHVAGCVITGGTVTELVMGREYGADFLAQFFPFITPESGQYAGRVTGFEPNGDIGYLVTVFAPYILTLFPGVWLIGYASYNRKFWLFGPGIVAGLASFYNVTGDFFEMGSIVSTGLVDRVTAGYASASIPSFRHLRSDDLFRLIKEISASPATYGMDRASGIVITLTTIVIAAFLAVLLAGYTYRLGRQISVIAGSSTRFSGYVQ